MMKITTRELNKIITAAKAAGLVVVPDAVDGVIKVAIYYNNNGKLDFIYDSYDDSVNVAQTTEKLPYQLYPDTFDNSSFVEVYNDIATHGRLVSEANERAESCLEGINAAIKAGIEQYRDYCATKATAAADREEEGLKAHPEDTDEPTRS